MKVKVQVLNDEVDVDETISKKARWPKYRGTIECAYDKYYYLYYEAQKAGTMYSILAEMAKNHKDELLQMWDEIKSKGVLYFDEDDPLYLSMDVSSQWLVYYDIYKIDRIDCGAVYFSSLK